MNTIHQIEIRRECLAPGAYYLQPSGPEVREVIRRLGMTAVQVSIFLGMTNKGGRQMRRWIAEEAPIPYSAWAILCAEAGLGQIWSDDLD
ncbi:XRE family transcriptional regulator [Robbsia sp. Bb-Pol-6]|uniref:XRE family transcriptional regulator n=1 Tax=Robbsia betulipollinis TaxID=2981849 RepID=A0ABT3ZQ54_9BURK|nr:XRE family transcriptional regulator [Robbsia betulipollinis]MCY0388412.1 XRE family transcriptional regulator [Robbsia betulipollinis]